MALRAAPALQAAPVFRAPWPVLAAALIAYLALGASVGSASVFAGLLLLALLLLASRVFDARLESNWLLWTIRLVLFALIIWAQRARHADEVMLYDTFYAGQLCAAELALQSWKKRPAGGPRAWGMLLLSTAVFVCALNTFNTSYVPYLAVAFFFCTALALADCRGAKSRGLALLLAAICLGAAVRHVMYVYRSELTMYAMYALSRRNPSDATGLSEAPMLGSTRLALGSNARVLRIQGALTEMHLRALSFDTYKQGAWGPVLYQRAFEPVSPAQLGAAMPGQRLQFTRLAEDCRYLFAPLNCAGLVPAESSNLVWDRELRGPILSGEGAPTPYAYSVILSSKACRQGPCGAPLSDDERRRCLALPEGADANKQRYPAVRELARRIGGQLSTPQQRVQAVVEYLRNNHEYSTSINAGTGDPVANFLLDRKAAHCEYFASAAVLLLRCLDVPSRYVTGYLAHESAGPDKMVVRGRDAHAWAESWIEGLGWVTVEATPPSGLPLALQPVSVLRPGLWIGSKTAGRGLVAWVSGLSWKQLLGRSAAGRAGRHPCWLPGAKHASGAGQAARGACPRCFIPAG